MITREDTQDFENLDQLMEEAFTLGLPVNSVQNEVQLPQAQEILPGSEGYLYSEYAITDQAIDTAVTQSMNMETNPLILNQFKITVPVFSPATTAMLLNQMKNNECKEPDHIPQIHFSVPEPAMNAKEINSTLAPAMLQQQAEANKPKELPQKEQYSKEKNRKEYNRLYARKMRKERKTTLQELNEEHEGLESQLAKILEIIQLQQSRAAEIKEKIIAIRQALDLSDHDDLAAPTLPVFNTARHLDNTETMIPEIPKFQKDLSPQQKKIRKKEANRIYAKLSREREKNKLIYLPEENKNLRVQIGLFKNKSLEYQQYCEKLEKIVDEYCSVITP